MSEQKWALALHGGAGQISRDRITPEKETVFRAALARVLEIGTTLLDQGADALDAVEAVVKALELDPLFNAGRGSVLTSDATFELDAAIMRGSDLQAGAVINVGHIAHPISLARCILENSDHVILAGDGAERFALQHGFQMVGPSYFDTPHRREQLMQAKEAATVSLDHSDFKYGTVGAVARDVRGTLAAATSTGGMTNKHPGRVGDTPLIGSGTYADNATCAVSATGHGEAFIRMCVARDIAAQIEYGNLSLADAVHNKVFVDLPKIKGSGGVIAVGRTGLPILSFNSNGMFRAKAGQGSQPLIAIFGD
tara:strand:+ start:19660 stop:20589 length:930 start_codon:yes stop_codon:yes gene_type:complete